MALDAEVHAGLSIAARRRSMSQLIESLRDVWTQNEVWQWGTAGITACCVLLAASLTLRWVRKRYLILAATERVELLELPLEIASKTSGGFLLVLALFAGLSTLRLPAEARGVATTVLTVVGFWQLGVWGSAAVLAWLMVRRKASQETDRAAVGSLGIIGFVMRILVWTLVMLLALDNLGVDITALVAGLGVGGIAVALAVQNVLGDLFASLSITLDRPFVLGDFIIVGDFMGSVEQIGVKSTRLRSLGGEQIIMSNADLLSSRVRNYGRMKERRVVFKLRVAYQTPRARIERIPTIIRDAISRQEGTRVDRCHFASYGDFALEFETVYYVLSPDYNRYMDIQQAINLTIHGAFEDERIEFAIPTQKLWLGVPDGDAGHALPLQRSLGNGSSREH
jgi:small-conductance mechanosensitive channel